MNQETSIVVVTSILGIGIVAALVFGEIVARMTQSLHEENERMRQKLAREELADDERA